MHMISKIHNKNGNMVIDINGKLYRPKASVLTDCFTGKRYFVDRMGTEFSFSPHETKFFIVEEKENIQ